MYVVTSSNLIIHPSLNPVFPLLRLMEQKYFKGNFLYLIGRIIKKNLHLLKPDSSCQFLLNFLVVSRWFRVRHHILPFLVSIHSSEGGLSGLSSAGDNVVVGLFPRTWHVYCCAGGSGCNCIGLLTQQVWSVYGDPDLLPGSFESSFSRRPVLDRTRLESLLLQIQCKDVYRILLWSSLDCCQESCSFLSQMNWCWDSHCQNIWLILSHLVLPSIPFGTIFVIIMIIIIMMSSSFNFNCSNVQMINN